MIMDAQGSMAGIDIEIVHHILSQAGYTITYQEAAWARQLKWIQNGTLHITASTMITPAQRIFEEYGLDRYNMLPDEPSH